jgi:hypothetical protein
MVTVSVTSAAWNSCAIALKSVAASSWRRIFGDGSLVGSSLRHSCAEYLYRMIFKPTERALSCGYWSVLRALTEKQ